MDGEQKDTPGKQWEQVADEMERFHRDSTVKLLTKRLRGLEEVNGSLAATIVTLREQLARVQEHNGALVGILQRYSLIRTESEPGARRKRWWERALDALWRMPTDHR